MPFSGRDDGTTAVDHHADQRDEQLEQEPQVPSPTGQVRAPEDVDETASDIPPPSHPESCPDGHTQRTLAASQRHHPRWMGRHHVSVRGAAAPDPSSWSRARSGISARRSPSAMPQPAPHRRSHQGCRRPLLPPVGAHWCRRGPLSQRRCAEARPGRDGRLPGLVGRPPGVFHTIRRMESAPLRDGLDLTVGRGSVWARR